MNRFFIAVLVACLPFLSLAQPPGLKDSARSIQQRIELPLPDMAKVAVEDAAAKADGAPLRYAIEYQLGKGLPQAGSKSIANWQSHDDGRVSWRLAIDAPGAKSIDLRLSNVFLPTGAELYLYSADGKSVQGPYTAANNKAHGILALPLVPSDRAVLELVVDEPLKAYVSFNVETINYGYYDFFNRPAEKSGSCNVDVVCPEGDPWRDQIQSVARYTFSGFLCTGQLINNTNEDRRNLFLTANHCLGGVDPAVVVVYWNYVNPTCRAPGSTASGTPAPLVGQSQSGASTVSGFADSDFYLIELDDTPPPDANVFYTGWDRRDRTFAKSVAIHHPAGDAKRISFEDQANTISSYLGGAGSGTTHIRVADWDLGTTEGGSSGSGLWNAQKRLVGQLHGGFAACGNDEPDWYGRVFRSWTGGGTSGSRLSDHLDPTGTGANVLDGQGTCDAPTATIDGGANPAAAGAVLGFSAEVSGGQAPYTLSWDFDNDGIGDSDLDMPDASWPQRGNYTVTLRVTDDTGCTGIAQYGQVVTGPQFDVTDTSPWQENSGDGDSSIEPGEVWSTTITVTNNGDGAIVAGSALFVPTAGAGSSKATGGPDGFGYTYSDSTEGDCAYDYQDISSGAALSFTASSSFPALDDGGTGPVALGNSFPFYGQSLDTLVMSSNGYLSTSAGDSGGDFSNDCGLIAPGTGAPGRINPMHDDLVIEAGYYQYFATCPRPADSGAVQGCSIFQWENASYFGVDAPPFFDLQAVLYDDGEMVYQHTAGDPFFGGGATIGTLSPSADDGLIYACDVANAMPDDHAVCIRPSSVVNENIVILNPVQDVGTLGAGGSRTFDVSVQIPDAFPCGDGFGLDLAGVAGEPARDYGYHERVVEAEVGVGGCDVVAAAPLDKGFGMPAPQPGLYYDPSRPGNAIDMHFYPDIDFLAFGWYTGRGGADGREIGWYQSAGFRTLAGQMCTDLISYHWNGTWVPGVDPQTSIDGRVCITQVDQDSAISHIRFDDGQSMVGRLEFFLFNDTPPPVDYTGAWAKSGENWGDAVVTQGAVESHVLFFYDDDGEPTVAQGIVDAGTNTAQMFSFRAHPPGAVWVTPDTFHVGTLSRTYNNADDGTFSTDIDYPAPYMATWQRTNESMQRITVDVP